MDSVHLNKTNKLNKKKENKNNTNKQNITKNKKKFKEKVKDFDKTFNNCILFLLKFIPYFSSYLLPRISQNIDNILYIGNVVFCIICAIAHICIKYYYQWEEIKHKWKNTQWSFNNLYMIDVLISDTILIIPIIWFLFANYFINNSSVIISMILSELNLKINLVLSFFFSFFLWLLSLIFILLNKDNKSDKDKVYENKLFFVISILFIFLFLFHIITNACTNNFSMLPKNRKTFELNLMKDSYNNSFII